MKGEKKLEAKQDEDGWDRVEAGKEDMRRWWEVDEDKEEWDVADEGRAGERYGMPV